MSSSALKLLAASGATDSATYVDDVFSTFLYEGGLSNPKVIQSGIDLSGEGGLVWTKSRTSAISHQLTDTVSGYRIESDDTAAGEASQANVIFNSDGHSYSGYSSFFNGGSENYCAWTFRKAPGFFDVVTWTGNGVTGRQIPHSLDSVPGMIIVKCTNVSGPQWYVYHRSTGNGFATILNSTVAKASTALWNSTTPTSTVFELNTDGDVNASGRTYIAYLFAHDAQVFGADEDESIIKCGTYAGNSGDQTIDVGFETQWVLIKNATSASTDWFVVDTMRGMVDTGAVDAALIRANSSDAEQTSGAGGARITTRSTGFGFINESNLSCNRSGETYIYMAIRRPFKPAEEFAATDLFDPQKYTGDGSTRVFSLPMTPDMVINASVDIAGDANCVNDRLRGGGRELYSNDNGAEYNAGAAGAQFDYSNKIETQSYRYTSSKDYINYHFKRAPGYFDVVAFTSDGSRTTQYPHNLGVVPEMVWVKSRSLTVDWHVWHKNLNQAGGYSLELNGNRAQAQEDTGSAPARPPPTYTATYFSTGGESAAGGSGSATYVAYFFASVDGISKVGSYTGTGNDLNVDCGFSAGARFVLIKRSDATGDWYVWDSARGIVAGNDPYLLLNTTAAQVTNTDYIDPLASGFTVTSSAPAALNNNGGTYIFYAIA